MKVLLHGMALGRELIHARAFDEMRGEELLPGADVKTEEAPARLHPQGLYHGLASILQL